MDMILCSSDHETVVWVSNTSTKWVISHYCAWHQNSLIWLMAVVFIFYLLVVSPRLRLCSRIKIQFVARNTYHENLYVIGDARAAKSMTFHLNIVPHFATDTFLIQSDPNHTIKWHKRLAIFLNSRKYSIKYENGIFLLTFSTLILHSFSTDISSLAHKKLHESLAYFLFEGIWCRLLKKNIIIIRSLVKTIPEEECIQINQHTCLNAFQIFLCVESSILSHPWFI